jgi:hypothetical protein
MSPLPESAAWRLSDDALTLLTILSLALLAATVRIYQIVRDDERPARRKSDKPATWEKTTTTTTWTWDGACHLCAARLTTAAHYIGGNRVVCPDCYDVCNAERAA